MFHRGGDGAATEAKPSEPKKAFGSAMASAGLFASRHGPCGLPAVFAARSRPTPRRRSSAKQRFYDGLGKGRRGGLLSGARHLAAPRAHYAMPIRGTELAWEHTSLREHYPNSGTAMLRAKKPPKLSADEWALLNRLDRLSEEEIKRLIHRGSA
jgi:hypothetical protein